MRKPQLIAECDRLFALRIKERDGYMCQWCGAFAELDCHHIIHRQYKALRFDPLNALTLCRECHQEAHRSPYLFKKFLVERFEEIFNYTNANKYKEVRADILFYEQTLKELKTKQFTPLVDDAILNL